MGWAPLSPVPSLSSEQLPVAASAAETAACQSWELLVSPLISTLPERVDTASTLTRCESVRARELTRNSEANYYRSELN